jgi:beta-galactosidase
MLYRDRATLLYASLRTRGINVDAVGRDRDWSRYRVLVVPFLAATDEAVIEKLVAFVASGGTLLLHPHCGERNEEGVFFPTRLHPKLETLLGVSVRDHATSANEAHRMSWRGREYCTGLLMNLPEVSDAAVEATYADDWFAKRAAMTRRNSGDGQAIYLATLPARAFYDAFFDALLDDRNVPRILGKDVPEAVEIIERSGDDGRRLVFLLNCTAEPQSVAIPSPMHDVWQEEDLSVAAELPPHGSRILMAPETGG